MKTLSVVLWKHTLVCKLLECVYISSFDLFAIIAAIDGFYWFYVVPVGLVAVGAFVSWRRINVIKEADKEGNYVKVESPGEEENAQTYEMSLVV